MVAAKVPWLSSIVCINYDETTFPMNTYTFYNHLIISKCTFDKETLLCMRHQIAQRIEFILHIF